MTNFLGSIRWLILFAIAAFAMLAALWPGTPAAHGELPVAANGVRVGHQVTWHKAASTKRSLGDGVLMLDIRRQASSAADAVFDARVPFVDQEADANGQMTFHPDFALKADDALRAAHLKHSSPVYLVCDDSRCGDLAAVLLHEHGYERVYVVLDPDKSPRRVSEGPGR